jgi:hypothetical protein
MPSSLRTWRPLALPSEPWVKRPLGELTLNFDSRRVPVKQAERRPGPYPYFAETCVLMYALSASDISGYLTGSTMPKLMQDNLNRIPPAGRAARLRADRERRRGCFRPPVCPRPARFGRAVRQRDPVVLACGRRGKLRRGQVPEAEAWVDPAGKVRPAEGLFVAQVVGESMNRRIPNGASASGASRWKGPGPVASCSSRVARSSTPAGTATRRSSRRSRSRRPTRMTFVLSRGSWKCCQALELVKRYVGGGSAGSRF